MTQHLISINSAESVEVDYAAFSSVVVVTFSTAEDMRQFS